MRARVDAHTPAGVIGALVTPYDIGPSPWWEYLAPVAELLYAKWGNQVEWTATPIPEEMSDKEALSGHAR